MNELRILSNPEFAAMFSAVREAFITRDDEDLQGVARDFLVEYLVEALRRASSPRFATLLLSRDVDRLLAELAERENP